MLSLQLGKLMVVLAEEKRYSELHTGSSKHLTDSDMYHFGSLFFFFSFNKSHAHFLISVSAWEKETEIWMNSPNDYRRLNA